MAATAAFALPAAARQPAAAGGAAAPGGGSSAAPTAPAVPQQLAPVTATKRQKPYRGPLYELNEQGQVVPYVPGAQVSQQAGGATAAASTGGLPRLLVPGALGQIVNGGMGAAPMDAPPAVQDAIWTANEIIGRPYVYGGGHASFISKGYDCSGTVSYALHGAGLLSAPLDSSEFMRWGLAGRGVWITIFTNPGHAYVDIAGLRLDTSAADDPSHQQGPRWRPLRSDNGGFLARHPSGL